MKALIVCVFLLSSTAASFAQTTAPSPLTAARASIAELDWYRAIELYTPIRDKAQKGSNEWSEATFCLATAQHHIQPPSEATIHKAQALYQDVVDHAAKDSYVGRSLLNLGRIQEMRDYPDDAVNFDGARDVYLKVVERFPNHPIAGEATLRAAATQVMAFDAPDYKKVKAGIDLLEKWLAAHPNDPLASVMWQYAGDSYFRPLADYKNSLRCYEEVDKLGWTDKGNQGPWYWRCAQMAERYLNDPDTAAKYYAKIMIETPNSGKAYESMQALRRLNKPVPHTALSDFEATTKPSTEGNRK